VRHDDIVDWALRPLTEQAAAIAGGEISAIELLEHHLDRVERINPAINAVVTIDRDRARDAARAADETTASGMELGPLHGVPGTIKDAIATAGMRSTGGAVELSDHVPTSDAPVVARVRAAGGVIYGKTNLPRWSGDTQATNEIFGTTGNPWAPERTPGGSSGGASAALAAGLSAFEVGTDIGGSIRVPAHFAGVCGHKPSFGVVPAFGYLDHPAGGTTEPDINVFGPLARTVGDLEVLFDVLAGPTELEATAWRLELPAPRCDDLRGFRVAAWTDDPACQVSSAVGELMEETVDALVGAGASIDRSARPDLDFEVVRTVGLPLISAAVSPGRTDEEFDHYRRLALDPDGADPVEAMRARSSAAFHRDWLALHVARQRARDAWTEFFSRFDVLLCPVAVIPAFPHMTEGNFYTRRIDVDGVERPYADIVCWTSLIGMAYLPSTVVPVGLTDESLPVGIQVVGPYLEDRTALAFARHVEAVTGGYRVPPLAR